MIKHSIKTLLFTLFALLGVATASAGGDQIIEQNVGDFCKLNITNPINVVYRCMADSAGYVRYTCPSEFDDPFIFKNSGDKLTVQIVTEDVDSPKVPTLYVYSDSLVSVSNSSDREIIVENLRACQRFDAMQMGNGKIVVDSIDCQLVKAFLNTGNGQIILSGTTKDVQFKMVGAGVIQADELKAQNARCKIMGGGSIGLWATQSLLSKGIGSTKIYYRGNPVNIKKSGGGKLIPITSGSEEVEETTNNKEGEPTKATPQNEPDEEEMTVVIAGED